MTAVEFNNTLLGMKPNLLKFALNLTRDREQAPDLVQDTYLKALSSRNQFSDFTNLKAWVFTIMKNTFINNYRRTKREHLIIDYSQDLYFINQPRDKGSISPESTYNENEIQTIIDSLSDDFRIPFRMILNGYKYKEVSDELNINIGTVKSRIFLARQKLMAQLRDYSR